MLCRFRGCDSLRALTLPEGLKRLDGLGCTNASAISFPRSLERINPGWLDETEWYKIQPEGMVYAGGVCYTYKGTIPENIEIREGTKGIIYLSGDNLTHITIPASVTYIYEHAFPNDHMLSITYGGTKEQWSHFTVFTSTDSTITCSDGVYGE